MVGRTRLARRPQGHAPKARVHRGAGLLGAAFCFALPQVLVDGFITPWYACHLVGVSKRHYLWRTFVRPMLCVAPFAAGLAVGSELVLDHPLWALAVVAIGSLVSGLFYLKWLIPAVMMKYFTGLFWRFIPGKSEGACL